MAGLRGIRFTDGVSREELARRVLAQSRLHAGCLTVVTPNIQHLQLAGRDPAMLTALNSADFVVPDGWPLAAALRIIYHDRRGRIAGADLASAVLQGAAAQHVRVAILGGTYSAADLAARKARSLYPGLDLVTLGQDLNLPVWPTPASVAALVGVIQESDAGVVLLCYGAPKSELHLHAAREEIGDRSVLCVGATVDYLAGTRRRAPVAVQRLGLEWAFRLLQEPRRLGPRYLAAGFFFTRLVLGSWRRRAASRVLPTRALARKDGR